MLLEIIYYHCTNKKPSESYCYIYIKGNKVYWHVFNMFKFIALLVTIAKK